MIRTKLLIVCFLAVCSVVGASAQHTISTVRFNDGIHHWNLVHEHRDYPRYTEAQYENIADNLIAYQNPDGGWMKNIDWLGILDTDSVKRDLDEDHLRSTLDNRNTFPQIEYLADVYLATKKEKYKKAALKGLEYLLTIQKDNGGWRGWDVDAITYNDDVTTGALELFRNILQGDTSFSWLDDALLNRIRKGYEKGISLTLRCQIVQDGVKAAWAQQYDNVTLEPVKARTFELPGISADESCGVILLLMGIDHPSKEVIDAVKGAVAWLERVKIKGIRVERIPLPKDKIINHEYPFDNVVVEDPDAEPIWARFYEVSDNTPFMCTRQGQKVWKLSDVNAERRTGYDWYGYWPKKVLAQYPGWVRKIESSPASD